jgi:hypothetical protein
MAPVPLASDLPRCGRLFCATRADDTCAHKRAVRRRRLTGSPQNRDLSRRGEGLPGYWAILFGRARVEHPAGYVALLAHQHAGRRCGLRVCLGRSASGKARFRGRIPLARMFACLRFAALLSETVARLATGSGGLTLGRTGFAPAG